MGVTDLRQTTIGDQRGAARPPSWSRRPLVACVLLGVGLGGFVDGIVLHQILQWHHMLTATGDHPADTVAGLESNTLADGLFHAATWLFVVAGIVVLRRAWAAGRPRRPSRHSSAVCSRGGGASTSWRASSTTTCSASTTCVTTSPTPCGGTSGSWRSGHCSSPSGSCSCGDVHGRPLRRRRTPPAEHPDVRRRRWAPTAVPRWTGAGVVLRDGSAPRLPPAPHRKRGRVECGTREGARRAPHTTTRCRGGTSPRQAPASAPRPSMKCLTRSRSPAARRLTMPSLSPTCSTRPSGVRARIRRRGGLRLETVALGRQGDRRREAGG